ncbi:MAG: pyridoxal-phosphate dependent enzyme, partial [Bacteroidota bacterium]
MKYISIKGIAPAVDFETAILNGFAPDGGLYVPEHLPKISSSTLEQWKALSYRQLVFEVLSLFIPLKVIPSSELQEIIDDAYGTFEKEETIVIRPLASRTNTHIMELFHGPTLSFKDVGLAFLVNCVQYFLEQRGEKQTIVVATTGDTGPAAAFFAAGKANIEAWPLFPRDKITPEQARQMTTLHHPNIHPVAVANCPEGGDDLDAVIKALYDNQAFKEKLNLSSVNSINWGRIMVQTVHYFYGYLQLAQQVGEPIHFCVPSGGFGNLCAGSLARLMGLPLHFLMVANNKNACLHRIFSEGRFSKAPIHETASSAIDIIITVNFWRYL